MAENQIQFVLNPKSFIGDKDLVIGFGPNKDFYIGMDNLLSPIVLQNRFSLQTKEIS